MTKLLDEAGIPLILVGDSLGMVVLGYPDTTHVTMAEMEHHVRAAARAKPRALLGADMPYRSYETVQAAVKNAKRLVAAGAEFVKAEGGREILPQVRAIISAGIPYCGHLGMLPQSVLKEGGYHVKGRSEAEHRGIAGRREGAGGGRRVCDCARTGDTAGRQGNHDARSHPDHRHRQWRRLRRADFGDARFDWNVPVVHATFCETARELRGGNQIRRGGMEKIHQAVLKKLFAWRSVE